MKNFILLFLLFNKVVAQPNLVPNYSFEDSSSCTTLPTKNASLPKPWYKPITGQCCSYIHPCLSNYWSSPPKHWWGGAWNYEIPKTGDGYTGIKSYGDTILFGYNCRGYVQCKLKDSLLSGKKYYSEFWTVLHDSAGFATNNIGMLFTKKAIYPDTSNSSTEPIYAMPQILNKGNPVIVDTMNWVKVSGIITASGGEQFITIGNFKGDQNTKIVPFNSLGTIFSDYFIDDVSVIPLDSICLKADAGRDTTIKIGDSVFVGSYTNGIDTLRWLNANTNTVIDSKQPGFWVKPTASTTYILYQIVNGCPSSDTVNVMVQPLPLKFTMYDVRCMNVGCGSSPRGNERSVENIWQTANEINVSHFNIQRSIDGFHFETIGKVVAKNNSLNVYNFIDDKLPNTTDQLTIYYRLQNVDKDGKTTYSTTQQITIKPQTPNNVFVFPNPAKDVVNVYCKEGIKEVKIYNTIGQQIFSSSLANRNDGSVQQTINLQQFTKGSYIIEIKTKNGKVFHEKIIKQ